MKSKQDRVDNTNGHHNYTQPDIHYLNKKQKPNKLRSQNEKKLPGKNTPAKVKQAKQRQNRRNTNSLIMKSLNSL
jgi:hypothetical protein